MLSFVRTRRWIVLLGAVVATGAVVGAVVAAERGPRVPSGLEAAIENEPLVKVLDFPGGDGRAGRSVFVQPTSAGFLCLWDAPDATPRARQGGCNSSEDPFAGTQMFISFAYDGGPAVADVKDARLIGLAAPAVTGVRVLMGDGSSRALSLRPVAVAGGRYRAFGYRSGLGDLRRGVGPVAVIASDETGAEIDRQATGFGE